MYENWDEGTATAGLEQNTHLDAWVRDAPYLNTLVPMQGWQGIPILAGDRSKKDDYYGAGGVCNFCGPGGICCRFDWKIPYELPDGTLTYGVCDGSIGARQKHSCVCNPNPDKWRGGTRSMFLKNEKKIII